MKKKQRKTSKGAKRTRTAGQGAAPPSAATAPNVDRRRALIWMRNGLIATPFVGAGVYASVQAVEASICELDLSKVGQGLPAIVQIHDPNCGLCQTLQRQARRALRQHDEAGFRYLVANINTTEGSNFAGRYGVPHVTLLFFDAEGEMVDTLRGPVPDEAVAAAIEDHLRRAARGAA